MKFLNILGLTLFSLGVVALISFSLYEFFRDTTVPAIIRYGILAIISGAIIILASLVKEKLKEK